MLELMLRKMIKTLEYMLMLFVYTYFLVLVAEEVLYGYFVAKPVIVYFSLLAMYYYTALLKKSPGSLLEFSGLEIRGMCEICRRLKSTQTHHCESCQKCYYKRDHHCPWVGKCIAAGNYREFYLFLVSLIFSLCLRYFFVYVKTTTLFFHLYLLLIIVLFFVYVNFLLCVDGGSYEHTKYHGKVVRTRSSSSWEAFKVLKLRDRIFSVILDRSKSNILVVIFPFLKRKVHVYENREASAV